MPQINSNDIVFMLDNLPLPLIIREKLIKDKEGLKLITADEFDILSDLCNDMLQEVGFDINYKLTPTGKILEELIDKIYEY